MHDHAGVGEKFEGDFESAAVRSEPVCESDMFPAYNDGKRGACCDEGLSALMSIVALGDIDININIAGHGSRVVMPVSLELPGPACEVTAG